MSALRSLRPLAATAGAGMRQQPLRGLSTTTRAFPATFTPRTMLMARGIKTYPPVQLNVSNPVADGGPEDIPHHGINVDKDIRMDT